ncbi:MAG: ATPase [Anaerolineae bacterium]|nr:cation-translocating P-type ATPase [Chloroflexi bacterium CFX2]MCQ3945124.1 ATPase [Anaerolineae bacterium]MCZ7550895.1 cation-translocating P-type ATPase [Anaerolineales bacterium]GER79194.1 cation-translocating P-type ATPase [Candidatus Denitrolinea symbiosum]
METNKFWHTQTTEQAFTELKSQSSGLSHNEVVERMLKYGANELQAAHRVSPWEILLDQFKNVLILILLGATTLSLFLGHGIESIVIAVIVLFAVLLGFIQEYRAERAIEALKQMAAPTASVLRDGTEVKIPARELVPGDVILLHTGDRMPADARLLEAVNLQIEEAALTGESVAVEKHIQPLPVNDLPVGDRKNMVYAGTAATYGRGKALVVATGMQTEFGKIAQLLQTVETGKTPLQHNLDKVGTALARAAFVVVAIIVALGLFRGQPFVEMLIFGIALAVAVVPEALPAVVTISLAIGVQKMVKRNALIRRLPAVETLGSTSVICSDKTGTLTKDEMTVRKIFAAGQLFSVSGAGYSPVGEFSLNGSGSIAPTTGLQKLLTAATLASDTHLISDAENESGSEWNIKGDPTEGALVVAAAKAGLQKESLDSEYPRVQEIPFSSETKRMTTLHQTNGNLTAYAKGAPEMILESCDWHLTADGVKPFDHEGRKQALSIAHEMASQALRVIAISTKPDATLETAQTGMTFLGLAGMIDPPRPEVKNAIAICEQAGIRTVMITGDHPVTAQAVARELGLLKTGRVVTGTELEAMSDEQFQREVETIDIYARVSPAHKLRVVTALQANDHIVAMTGDGVNDAPSLKKADIGIAMGITGTDVTKEAAAMMLTDDNFASIVAAVEEGRGVFDNIKKYLMYLLSSNIGEIGLMTGATLLGLPLPLTAVQILYVNLATDGLPALALAVDPAEKGLMKRNPRNPRTGIFTRPVVSLMVTGGLWSTLINLGLFVWATNSGRSIEEAMTMTFVSLVLIQFFKAYNFRSDRNSVFLKPFANKWLNRAILWEVMLLIVLIYVPFLHDAFDTYYLPLVDWLIVLGLAVTVMPVLELVKWMERKGWFGAME